MPQCFKHVVELQGASFSCKNVQSVGFCLNTAKEYMNAAFGNHKQIHLGMF